ncbi:MAG: hypothetical protein VCF07_11890 [Nitrospinota bacterium]
MKRILAPVFLCGLILSGCGEDGPLRNQLVGKWKHSEKQTANDKKNRKVKRLILDYIIDHYMRKFEIKLLPDGQGISFHFPGKLPVYYEVLEEKEGLIVVREYKKKKNMDIEIQGGERIKFTITDIVHPLIKIPEKEMVVYFSREKEKEKK